MAANRITWSDKVAINPETIRINQVTDDDLNDVKDAINNHAELIDASELGPIATVENEYADIETLLGDQAN